MSELSEGVVTKKTQGYFYVESDSSLYECKLRGLIKRYNEKNTCITGDKVLFSKEEKVIEKIIPRKNQLNRPAVANIDVFVASFAAKSPDLDLDKLNLVIMNVLHYNINPVIVINKIDLLSQEELSGLKTTLSFIDKLDIKVFYLSAYEKNGIDSLKTFLSGKISAFGGPSGVGKSSMLNLIQNVITLPIGEVSTKLQQGKHTTKDTLLLKLDFGGYVADTPGFNVLDIPNISNQGELMELFPDIFNIEESCFYKNCSHIVEPKCAIKKALEQNEISNIRYEFYKKTYISLKERWKETNG